MIPRIFHQTWKNKDIPEEWKGSYNSCQSVMASYVKKLWTDDEMEAFVKENYPDMYDTYMGYTHHIQRCDSFRYMLLYKMGGVYLDMDIACKLSIDPLLTYDVVLAKSPNMGNYVTNSILMSMPGHPFFRYVIDQLKVYKDKFKYLGKHLHVMNSTGPVFFTDVYHEYVKNNGPIQNMYMMTKEEFSGDCSVCSDTCSGGTYFTHVTGRSWNSWDSTLFNALMCHWYIILIIIIVSIIVYSNKKIKKAFTKPKSRR